MSGEGPVVAGVVAALAMVAGTSGAGPDNGGAGDEGAVITATSFSRSPSSGEHTYVECGPPGGDSQYRVEVGFEDGHGDVEGQPCPAGPRELLAQDENPELYRLLQEEMNAPRRFEGGDLHTCGAWGTDDPADARRMLAECGPLTRGEL